jgi:hypothetical protein
MTLHMCMGIAGVVQSTTEYIDSCTRTLYCSKLASSLGPELLLVGPTISIVLISRYLEEHMKVIIGNSYFVLGFRANENYIFKTHIRGGIKIKLENFNKKTMVRVRKVFISKLLSRKSSLI